MTVRQTYIGTVESGRVSGPARLDLGEVYLWLYPDADGKVIVEFEDKPIS
ncbi:MAG TPA: hypothetical protein VHK27_14630 [Gammaproteobacteria bacterium]|nr:hypothetical protein [Gammaproteobacteria bacterium]